jgi:hypothetical protein
MRRLKYMIVSLTVLTLTHGLHAQTKTRTLLVPASVHRKNVERWLIASAETTLDAMQADMQAKQDKALESNSECQDALNALRTRGYFWNQTVTEYSRRLDRDALQRWTTFVDGLIAYKQKHPNVDMDEDGGEFDAFTDAQLARIYPGRTKEAREAAGEKDLEALNAATRDAFSYLPTEWQATCPQPEEHRRAQVAPTVPPSELKPLTINRMLPNRDASKDLDYARAIIQSKIPRAKLETLLNPAGLEILLASAPTEACRMRVREAASVETLYTMIANVYLRVAPKEALSRYGATLIEAVVVSQRGGTKDEQLKVIERIYGGTDAAANARVIADQEALAGAISAPGGPDDQWKSIVTEFMAGEARALTDCQDSKSVPTRLSVSCDSADYQILDVAPPADGETTWRVRYRRQGTSGTWSVAPNTRQKAIGTTTCNFAWGR